MSRVFGFLPSVPIFLRGEPGRNMLLIFMFIVIVVSFGDIILPLIVLYAAGYVGGKIASWLKQPSLVGMLIAGCFIRNVLPHEIGLPLVFFSDCFRSTALGLIMLRAGLGLEVDALLAQPLRLGFLALIPCFAEVIAVIIISQYCFIDFDWKWGTLLGFCLADVSPAVTVPLLLDLQSKGYGNKRGIPSVLIAAASLNAVIAIVGFGVALKLIFNGTNENGSDSQSDVSPWIRSFRSIILGLGEITVGLFLGATTGWMFSIGLEYSVSDERDRRHMVPFLKSSNSISKSNSNGTLNENDHTHLPTFIRENGLSNKPSDKYRFHEDIFDETKYISSNSIAKKAAYPYAFMLSSVAALAIGAGKYLHIYGAGALTCVVLGLSIKIAAQFGDRELTCLNECEVILSKWWDDYGAISLFVLLGAAIDFNEVDPTIVLLGVGLVTFALLPRAISAYFCSNATCVSSHEQDDSIGGNNLSSSSSSLSWTHNEKLFAAVAWCPKATVQAALSTVALDTVLMLQKSHHYLELGDNDPLLIPDHHTNDMVKSQYEEDYRNAHIVLTVAVVSIFWTCLPFAGLITYLGPKLLTIDELNIPNSMLPGDSLLEKEDSDDDDDNDGQRGKEKVEEVIKEEEKAQHVKEVEMIDIKQETNSSLENDISSSEQDQTSSNEVSTKVSQTREKLGISLNVPQSSSPNKNKKRNKNRNVASSDDTEDLLGLGPNVPVIKPPPQKFGGHGRFQTTEEKSKHSERSKSSKKSSTAEKHIEDGV